MSSSVASVETTMLVSCFQTKLLATAHFLGLRCFSVLHRHGRFIFIDFGSWGLGFMFGQCRGVQEQCCPSCTSSASSVTVNAVSVNAWWPGAGMATSFRSIARNDDLASAVPRQSAEVQG